MSEEIATLLAALIGALLGSVGAVIVQHILKQKESDVNGLLSS